MNLDVAERLAQMRRRRGLSQGELARKLGLSRQAVSKWERGESSPDTENLIALADLYGVSLDELVRTAPGPADQRDDAPDRPADGDAGSDDPPEGPSPEEPPCAADPPEEPPRAADPPTDLPATDAPARQRGARSWTRRGAIGLGVAAAFSLGVLFGAGEVPYPGGFFDFKRGVRRLLGRPEVLSLDLNTADFRDIVVEWPAGTVEFVAASADFPLAVEETSYDGTLHVNRLIEDGTLRLWDGDARAWDDPALGHDLRIWLPAPTRKDERGRDVGGWSFDTLTLNTSTATFNVAGIAGRRLVATLREGSITDLPTLPEGVVVMPRHGLEVEELELDVDGGVAHVRAGFRSLKLRLAGGTVFASLADGARSAGEAFAADATIEGGAFYVHQPNEAEGCTVHLAFAEDGGEACFTSSFKDLAREPGTSTYRRAGDASVQTGASPLVRTQDEIAYRVSLASGSFGLYGSRAWETDVDEPALGLGAPVESCG